MKLNRTAIQDVIIIFIAQAIWVKFIFTALGLFVGIEAVSREQAPLYFLAAVIIAPVWEEIVWRWLPIEFGKKYFPKCLKHIIICSCILFGLGHGGSINILIQGALGLSFSYIYLNHGLKWSMLSHAIWNLYCFTY